MGEEKLKTTDKTKEQDKKRKITLRTIVVCIAIIIFSLVVIVTLRAEYLNILEIGKEYTSVFIQNMQNKAYVALTSFVITYILVYIANKFIKKGLKTFFEDEKKEMPKLPNKSIAFILGLIVAFIVTIFLTETYALFANAAVFGKTDGVFGTDIGYYIFTLPFVQNTLITFIVVFIGLIAYTALYYIITFNVCFDGVSGEMIRKSLFIKQMLTFLMIAVVLFSGYIILISQNILTGDMISIEDVEETKLAGAGLTDLTIKLWGYRILAIIIIIAVVRFIKYLNKQQFNECVKSMAIVPIYLLILFILMTGFQFLYVNTNELDKEQTYIANNIEKTKDAYGINIDQTDIASYSSITYEEIEKNQDLINNIPLITEEVTLSMLEEHQESSGYYSYDRTRIANYNGKLVYITPREILNDSDVSYNNKTLKYTHGYSAVITSATDSDADGYAEYILSDYTEQSALINITEPRIYFGLETNSIIATNTEFGKEYDYPITATKYQENVYDGEAGLNLNFWDRLVLALSNKDLKLAFSSYINEDTKIITQRNILERVETVLPNIKYDENPYLVISEEGKLIWVIDGYTTSNQYPYSQMTVLTDETGAKEKINYIRNSVKVLVDAYDGTTTFYITDRTDPIIMTYEKMYPELFAETDIPSDIKEHLLYPEFLYTIQSNMIAMYHDVSEDTLYRGDDVWKITPTTSNTSGTSMSPYYTMLKTVNSKENELGLVVTFNKEKKQSITAYLVGTYENGEPVLNLYKFSDNSNVAGIAQLNSQIEQDETILEELNSLNDSGMKIIKDMIIIPIDDTLLYVEPIYQVMLNEDEEIPILKKVIVASGNTVAIGNNLTEALANLFTDYAVDFEFIDTEDIEALIDAVIKANNNFEESMNANDLEMMAKDLNKLKNLINQLENARTKELEKEAELEEMQKNENSAIDELIDSVENLIDVGETVEDESENIIEDVNTIF